MSNLVKKIIDISTKKKIKEELPIFDRPEFKDKVNGLQDVELRHNVEQFLRDGFIVIKKSVSDDLVNTAVSEFKAWKERNKQHFPEAFFLGDDRLTRVLNIQKILPSFRKLFYENASLQVQDFLFQKETTLYSSLFFEIGSSQDIHRDEPYFWTQPAHNYFGTWLALEDTDENNGPLVVIPGSHKIDPAIIDKLQIAHEKYEDVEKIGYIDEDLWNRYQKEIQKLCSDHKLQLQEVHVNKGDTIIWHPLLAHGGAKIKDQARTRLSFVFHTTPMDTPVTQINTFFNPDARVKTKAGYKYEESGGRHLNVDNHFTIGHDEHFDYSKLK